MIYRDNGAAPEKEVDTDKEPVDEPIDYDQI
jgi:hypothetical protein